MFNSLDASDFSGAEIFYEKQFEDLLGKIISCYHLMIDDGVQLENDENKIRDFLLINYLKNNDVRNKIGITLWHFEREVQEDFSIGRTDIKIISQNTFLMQEAYYIIECKRLDNKNVSGISGLNAHYLEEGVKRFTTNYYSSYYRSNCMIGFVVEKQNIDKNIEEINNLLLNHFSDSIITHTKITRNILISNFQYSYKSKHSDSESKDLSLHHLMFDFSQNIAA